MPPRAHASRLVAAVLAVVALISSAPAASVLAARLSAPVAPQAPVVAPAGAADPVAETGPRVAAAAQSVADSAPDLGPHHAPSAVAPPPKAVAAKPAPKPKAKTAPKATAVRTVKPAPAPATPAASYHGTNHMWMPALGINRSIAYYPCSRTTVPGLAVYRWGCAGANNVYLFAHAYAAFKPLHDAYVAGRLRKGMKVMYADGSGHVRTYAISWWRLTTPDKGEFAFAAQSRPSLTLQTCVGSRSQYRLIVRLVQVG